MSSSSFVGYCLIGPVDLETERIRHAHERLRVFAEWAQRYCDWTQKDPSSEKEEEELYREALSLGIDQDFLEEIKYTDFAERLAKSSKIDLDDFIESWHHGDDCALSRKIPGTEKQVFTCGGVTWGENPQTKIYLMVDFFERLGIIALLDIE